MKFSLFTTFWLFAAVAQAGIVTNKFKWDKKEIRICWAQKKTISVNCNGNQTVFEGEGPIAKKINLQKYKKLIQDTVNAEFSVAKTGIAFVGWENCSVGAVNKSFDAIISISAEPEEWDNFGGGSSVGDCRKVDGNDRRSITQLSLKKGKEFATKYAVTFENYIRFVSLHEFGHLAGLHHEDYIQYPSSILPNSVIVSDYNPISVMSYAFEEVFRKYGTQFHRREMEEERARFLDHLHHSPPSMLVTDQGQVTIKPILSTGDLHSLKCLYVFDETQKKKNCR